MSPARRPVRLPDGHLPQSAILYCRISDSHGTTHGVMDQERRLRIFFEGALGWGIREVMVENDTSAFRRRKIRLPNGDVKLRVIRPQFRRALELMSTGECDGFGAIHLDRAMRDPRDLEDMIELVELYNITVRSVEGSLDLSTDAGITAARIMVAIANQSSRDTSRRVAARKEVMIKSGDWHGGRRPFGYSPDGMTPVAEEARLVEAGCRDYLTGVSLLDQVKELRTLGVTPTTGGQWRITSWRQVLLRPRNAGLIAYRGEIVGPAPWPAIVPRDIWTRFVHALESNPRRRPSRAPRSRLGSGLYICGRCGATLTLSMARTTHIYRCSYLAHLSRNVRDLDEYVTTVLLARLSRPDAATLLRPPAADETEVDIAATYAEIDAIHARVQEMARDRALGLITRDEQISARDAAQTEIARLTRLVESARTADSPAVELITADDILTTWEGMSLSRQRSILSSVMTVVAHPIGRGRRYRGMDRPDIQIEWRPTGELPPSGLCDPEWPPAWVAEWTPPDSAGD